MANTWFRMYAEFATDPKVQSMPEAMQRRLTMLLCMRCSDVTVTLCDEELAFALRISDAELAETKALFLRKGFINDAWEIMNWEKRQFASDSSAERTRAYRERQKQVAGTGETSQKRHGDALDTDTDSDTDTEKKQKREKQARASRLSPDWTPSEQDIEYCKTERPDLSVQQVAANFRDYWLGSGKVKADWAATWRTWVRNEKQQPARASPQYQTKQDQSRAFLNELTGNRHDQRTPPADFIDVEARPVADQLD